MARQNLTGTASLNKKFNIFEDRKPSDQNLLVPDGSIIIPAESNLLKQMPGVTKEDNIFESAYGHFCKFEQNFTRAQADSPSMQITAPQ